MTTLRLATVFAYVAMTLAESYDYVIVGAGTSGLVVANRLSEDPSVTVAVIEPGSDQRNNPNVTDLDKFTNGLGSEIDWQYKSVKQPRVGNRELPLPQGKAYGGSSTINGMTYIRGDVAEIDAWEGLGNAGWTWASLMPYYKKSERYTIPNDTQREAGVSYDSELHGFDGPVHVGYPPDLVNGSFSSAITQTWEGLGLKHNPDVNSGDTHGFSMGPQTLDRDLGIRWDASRAYYLPVEERSNLKILKGTVKSIIWAAKAHKMTYCERTHDGIVANGVEYVTGDGKRQVLDVKREVVVSAGSMRTPLVLEGSGIGNPSILESLGIETQVNLPGVGENLIEQTSSVLVYGGTLDPSASAYHVFVTAADLFGSNVTQVAASTRALLPQWSKSLVSAASPNALQAANVEKLLTIQHDLLFKQNVTFSELLTVVRPGVLAAQFWPLFPFSRGSVHLAAKEKIDEPVIDFRHLHVDFDYEAMVATGELAQRFWFSKPMADLGVVGPSLVPGEEALPNNASEGQWEAFIRNGLSSNAHPVGSAAMMARELGGVVDPELRVYGTANVRVVDASVMPTQISGHLTATLYAIVERASEIIKNCAAKEGKT